MLATNGTEKSENSFVQTGNRNEIVRGDLAQVTHITEKKENVEVPSGEETSPGCQRHLLTSYCQT